MSNFPAVNGKETIRASLKLGFRLSIEGSHHVLVKEHHPVTIPVPVHGSRTLPAGTLASIIKMADITKKEFFEKVP
jgi:predicted RNA binding protein YcfA (HicA-like mRNA interferase family)